MSYKILVCMDRCIWHATYPLDSVDSLFLSYIENGRQCSFRVSPSFKHGNRVPLETLWSTLCSADTQASVGSWGFLILVKYQIQKSRQYHGWCPFLSNMVTEHHLRFFDQIRAVLHNFTYTQHIVLYVPQDEGLHNFTYAARMYNTNFHILSLHNMNASVSVWH